MTAKALGFISSHVSKQTQLIFKHLLSHLSILVFKCLRFKKKNFWEAKMFLPITLYPQHHKWVLSIKILLLLRGPAWALKNNIYSQCSRKAISLPNRHEWSGFTVYFLKKCVAIYLLTSLLKITTLHEVSVHWKKKKKDLVFSNFLLEYVLQQKKLFILQNFISLNVFLAIS